MSADERVHLGFRAMLSHGLDALTNAEVVALIDACAKHLGCELVRIPRGVDTDWSVRRFRVGSPSSGGWAWEAYVGLGVGRSESDACGAMNDALRRHRNMQETQRQRDARLNAAAEEAKRDIQRANGLMRRLP